MVRRALEHFVGTLGLGSIAIVTTSARTAHALGPVDVEVGAKAGSGTPFGNGPALSRLGFGLGARAGMVMLEHLYVGMDVTYYFGSSTSGLPLSPGNQSNTPSYSTAFHSLLYGVEAGWGFEVNDIVTFRPHLGLGIATFPTSVSCGGCGSSFGATNSPAPDVDTPPNNLYLEPGFTGLVALGAWFVGADANMLVLPGLQAENGGGVTPAVTLHVQGGVKF